MSGGFFGWIKRLFEGGPVEVRPFNPEPVRAVHSAPPKKQAKASNTRKPSAKRSSGASAKNAEHIRQRKDHWAYRLPQLLENVDRPT